ncbi:uncharacterized protein HD556DRAFT_1435639 [Suillus plorans]|uniref:DUF6532 domain-containing protein n=1 Tax=Suillus plorans TaxID=116603 RepID=A0A9P7E2U1_9AGAM|nr:uncharacterized protein HD556DRAFT_1435639 [Suillus plorans]KAG1809905.1 hypothetical protein HD556DRAFT_1435639 [Suillus plorans]
MCAKRQQHDIASSQGDTVSSQHDTASSQHDMASSQHDKSESEEADDDSDQTNFDGTDSSLSDFKDPKSIVKTLSTEIPSFVSSTKAKNQAVTVDKQFARARKRATETPMWADDLLSESEESRDEPAPKSDSDTSIFVKSEQDSSDAERMGSESSSRHSGSSNAKLILTDNGKVKNGKVEARVPLFRGELKDDACSQVTAYFCLGSDSAASAKLFIDNHSYHYSMQFSDDNTPKPVRHKPYQGNIIMNIMKGCYFNGSKSVSGVFAHKFTEIMKNKANRPEVSIPMVTLTSTLVYVAFFWKAQSSPPKFNFMGNQFSKVYVFHVQFLEDLKKNTPQKFHKLMADILLQ